MKPRHVAAGGVRGHELRFNVVERQRRRIDNAGARRAKIEQIARHDGACIEANLTASDKIAATDGDEIRRAWPRANKVHGHGLVHTHCVTGIAGRQQDFSPTGAAREIAMRINSPPSTAWRAISRASVSSVTALTTSRPPDRSARAAVSSTPESPAPPPTNTASGDGKPASAAGAEPSTISSPGTPNASALRPMRSA